MRRLLAISLLLLFGLPLAAPLFALGASEGAGLPACCRRNGTHHCIGQERMDAGQGMTNQFSAVHEKCPAFPHSATSARQTDVSLHSTALFFAEVLSHPATKPQTQAVARIALDRSRQKRGPPAPQA